MTGGDHFQPKKPEEPTVEQLQWELKAANTRLEKQAAYAVDNMALAEQIARLDGEKAATEKEVVRLRGLVDAQQKTVDQVGSENLELEKRVAILQFRYHLDAYYEGLHDAECEMERTDGTPTNGYQAMCWRASSARKALSRKDGKND